MENNKNRTVAGTDVDEVKRQIAGGNSNGSTAGAFSSTTDPQKVKEEIAQEAGPFGKPAANQSFANKTATGTDIDEVKRQNAGSNQNYNQ